MLQPASLYTDVLTKHDSRCQRREVLGHTPRADLRKSTCFAGPEPSPTWRHLHDIHPFRAAGVRDMQILLLPASASAAQIPANRVRG